jgi:O-antigen/teichoic acid export membrane protein
MISLSFFFLPELSARYTARNEGAFFSLWKKYGLLTMGITGTFALAVRMAGGRVIHLLYAGKFDELVPMLFVLALVPLTMAIGNTLSDAIRAVEKPRLIFYAVVSSALATFVIGLPLVRYFGLQGAVYGMIVSGITFTAALAVAFRRYAQRRPAHARVDIYSSEPPVPTSEVL